MQIELTPEQSDFIRRALDEGRLRRAEDALAQGLQLWIERERRRDDILNAVDEAEASLAIGDAIPITKQSIEELAADVKHRGRARRQAKRASR